jgi:adenosylcobinamide-GDP ribazoletransferase
MSRHPRIRDLGLAVTQLTAIPLPVRWPEGEQPEVAAWYPWVGLLLGLLLAVTTWAVGLVGSVTISALSGILVLGASSRLLHWDGLADVADAWYAPRDRRLEIMRDSRVGSFGSFAVGFALISYYALLSSSLTATGTPDWALLAVPFFGRLSATFAAWFGASARTDGLGAAVHGHPSLSGVSITAGALSVMSAAVVVTGATTIGVLVICVALALVIPHLISLRFGGVTGDVMGASVVVTELGVLLVMIGASSLTAMVA